MSKPTTPIRALLPTYLTRTTRIIAHLNHLLAHTSTLDTTLLTLSYTLHLLAALLFHPPKSIPISHQLSRLTTSLSPLAALFDDYRNLLRLSGLLGIYSWAADLWTNSPGDGVMRGIRWAQVGALVMYQALENAVVLAERGVIGWGAGRRERVARWSLRAWCLFVGLELGRLGVEGRRMVAEERRRVTAGGKGEEVKGKGEVEGGMERTESEVVGTGMSLVDEKGELQLSEERAGDERVRKRWAKWRTEVGINAAYAPMTVHYSLKNGPLSDGVIAALGCVVAWLTFGQAWRESA